MLEDCPYEAGFETCLAPVLPDALVHYMDEYSSKVYGVPGVLTLESKIRILWPELLPDSVLAALPIRCNRPWSVDAPPALYINPFENFLTRDAIWVHRPIADWPTT